MGWHPWYTTFPPGLEENKGGRRHGTSEGKGGGRGKDEGKGGRSRGASEGKGGGRSRGKSEGKGGGRGRGKGEGGEKKYPPLPEAPAGVELPGSWLEHFPHGHYMECTWPVTKAKYPAKEERASWASHETIADEYSCVVKLGGRQTQKRKGRAAPARLVVKGIHVEQCFLALLKESRRAFKGDCHIVLTSKTAPLTNSAVAAQQQPATAKASVVSASVEVVAAVQWPTAATRNSERASGVSMSGGGGSSGSGGGKIGSRNRSVS